MVKPFHFSRLPLIFFGTGKIKLLPGLIRRYGKIIILVTDQVSFKNSVNAENLSGWFRMEGIRYHNIIISGEPSPELIDAEVRKFNNESVDAVVSIGGGSILDAGKAISAMMHKQESVKEYLEGVGNREHPGTKLPFIALPTTSGTGSEATKNAVLSQTGKDGFKKSLRHDNFVPDIAVIDPMLTESCPQTITAASGMDCFTQLTESFLSDKSCEYTDAFAWEGLKAIKSSLLESYLNGANHEARSNMSFAALTSGICLTNAGLGAVHGFASSIGGMFVIPHGVVCGTLMASANSIIIRELRKYDNNSPALKKYSSLGRLFLGDDGKSDDYYIDGFVEHLNKLTCNLKLPKLKQYGIRENDIQSICENTDIKNNPVNLTREDLIEILYNRL
jgi:alcohol dehydrogenase class IV